MELTHTLFWGSAAGGFIAINGLPSPPEMPSNIAEFMRCMREHVCSHIWRKWVIDG